MATAGGPAPPSGVGEILMSTDFALRNIQPQSQRNSISFSGPAWTYKTRFAGGTSEKAVAMLYHQFRKTPRFTQ
jgi:hypothetical protein